MQRILDKLFGMAPGHHDVQPVERRVALREALLVAAAVSVALAAGAFGSASGRRWSALRLVPALLLISLVCISMYRSRLRGLVSARELRDNSQRDRLTGLATRSLLMERLQAAIVRVRGGDQTRFAVLFLDFDRFKLVNDSLGHAAGDELLRQIAGRLRASLRAADLGSGAAADNVIARFGGDEFVVLLNDLSDSADAVVIGERLLNALLPAYSVRNNDVHSSASIGIVGSDAGATSAEIVVRNADVAMYEAKQAGRNCCMVFNEGMHQRLSRSVSIEAGLRRAMGTAELSLVYQPIVELATGRMVSIEALLRWQHPTLGAIAPSEFIPVAEDSGLIVPLGQWVLKEACAMLARWRHEDPASAPQSVSVNVSRAELATGPRLQASVRSALGAAGLAPECLLLEITERETARDPAATRQIMQQLIGMGVQLAMDDFGTGSSSLACLRDFPFQTIKIDRSFVQDLATDQDMLAVIHATVTLIENLGRSSVAEGVECATQAAILQSLGCRYAQGYHFYRPARERQLRAMQCSSDQQAPLARLA
jgi:diguanylate cyclase (GGDEF)-like protein